MAEQLTAKILSGILKSHGEWLDGRKGNCANLRGANLRRANLRNADLRAVNLCGANLRGANLYGANLYGANLCGADLCGADLRTADLYATNLCGADLRNAELQDAKLQGSLLVNANIQGAKLQGATLPTREKWETYCSIVVPALCTAGGQSLALVAEAWECHDSDNCPMAVAFGVHIDEIPILHQPRVRQFIHLFDAKLIPNPFA